MADEKEGKPVGHGNDLRAFAIDHPHQKKNRGYIECQTLAIEQAFFLNE